MIDIAAIRARYQALEPVLDEKERRLFAASEARAAGHGGIVAVSLATGIARSTIGRGLADLRSGAVMFSPRARRRGGGGKPATEGQPGLLEALNGLVQSSIRGDPEAALLWVSKSQRRLYAALAEQGFSAGQKLLGRLLKRLGFSLQANAKTREGTSKSNRIEHRLFAFITMNWRGKPLVSYQAIIQLIASTTTTSGLAVTCRLDDNDYEKGIKVSDDEMASLNVKPDEFHGEWNYTIAPRKPDA